MTVRPPTDTAIGMIGPPIISTRNHDGRPVILAVLAGREKETVKAFLEDIHESLRATG